MDKIISKILDFFFFYFNELDTWTQIAGIVLFMLINLILFETKTIIAIFKDKKRK